MRKSLLQRKTPLKRSLRPLRRSPLEKGKCALKKSKLKPMSRKRKEVEGPEYKKLSNLFLKDHPFCEGCRWEFALGRQKHVNPSTEIQHKALRGKWYLRTDTWAAVCREHGERCTTDNPWAYESGLRMTREQIRLLEESQ